MTLSGYGSFGGELDVRPTLLRLEAEPAVGDNFEVFLLIGLRILSSSRQGGGSVVGCRLDQALDLDAVQTATVRDYLACPDAGCLALALPNADRVLLIVPWGRGSAGEAVAILPHIGENSVLRVLRHSFAGRVRVCAQDAPHEQPLRAADETTYQYLQNLLLRCRVLLGSGAAAAVEVTDRKQLSYRVLTAFHVIEHFLGIGIPGMNIGEFPIAFPYRGVFRPLLAHWMQLLLILGLRRGFSRKVWDAARFTTDHELLLPMLEIPVGNRTPLPAEWEECRRLARCHGMFFDIRRKRDAVCVRFCPLTPYIPPQEFYSVRAMAPIVMELGEMRLR